jgi:hypothetical protein
MPLTHSIKEVFIKFLSNFPSFKQRIELYREYKSYPHAPGHYYSVIPDLNEVQLRSKKIFENNEIGGINLREGEQLQLLNELKAHYKQMPYRFSGGSNEEDRTYRFKPQNDYYRYGDAIFLFCMMLYLRPSKIIEVGSGYSSSMMLDTNENFLQNKALLTFVEPYPEERLYSLLKEGDENNTRIIRSFVQDTDLDIYKSLEANDILFIDSSHVSKPGSDVNFIFFNILPILKPGVFIHFHDIFYPFELPASWVLENKWFWNENYILRAFLMNNPDYEIVLFNNLLYKKYSSWFEEEMPEALIDWQHTGSIWLRKIK